MQLFLILNSILSIQGVISFTIGRVVHHGLSSDRGFYKWMFPTEVTSILTLTRQVFMCGGGEGGEGGLSLGSKNTKVKNMQCAFEACLVEA